MLHRIHVLDDATIDKIAAGEVVERPASVVKELTENAIDAGADRISISIESGGITMIRVSDNGRGIGPEDVPYAFMRHATSKITTAADLSTLHSLGFRGEALSSIAAVSRTELITKQAEDLTATRYCVEGGRECVREEIGAPDGTTITVRDLFFNTPARAKFLKTPATEASHVSSCVEQLVLSNPTISFQFSVNGQVRLTSPGNGNVRDALYHIYGRTVTQELLSFEKKEDGLSMEGFLARSSVSRGNRSYENYYVNGRYVRSKLISRAVEEGYSTKLMQHQYPFTCFFLTVDGKALDVNVHPSKMEVRFSDEKKIYDFIVRTVRETLAGKEMIPSADGEGGRQKREQDGEKRKEEKTAPFETHLASASGKSSQAVHEAPPLFVSKTVLPERSPAQSTSSGVSRSPASPQQPVQASFLPDFLSSEAKPLRRMVGCVFKTYWIFEFEGKMYLMDQHAAHERVLFERLMRGYRERRISSQELMPPIIVTLNMLEENRLRKYMPAFEKLGFEIEPFGGRDYAVRAVPYDLGTIDSEELFLNLLDSLETEASLEELKIYIHRVATEACKAAVKGGGEISFAEAASLLDQLMKCEDPYHCPHGRPTLISFSRQDLEKRFKRIV